MTSLYQHQTQSPFHISVGAVLVNADGKIMVHKKTAETTPAEFLHTNGGLSEVYILIRESVEDGETLEQAVLRGLQEEFGVIGKVVKYLGSIQIPTLHARIRTFEKTTLYFLVTYVSQCERSVDDGEAHSELIWADPTFLLKQMQEQGRRANREDLDESKIIESFMTFGKA